MNAACPDLIRYARRAMPPISAGPLQESQRAPVFEEVTGIPFGLQNHIWLNGDIYLHRDEVIALKETILRLIERTGHTFLSVFAERCCIAMDNLTATAGTVSVEYMRGRGREDDDREELLGRWFSSYRAACAFIPVFRVIGEVLPCTTINSDSVPPGYTKYFNTEQHHERHAIEDICVALRTMGDFHALSQEAARLIQCHLDKYSWLGMRWYDGEPFSFNDIKRRILLHLQPTPPPAIDAPEIAEFIRVEKTAEALAILRTQRSEQINKAIWLMRPVFFELAGTLGTSYRKLIHLYPDELLESLRLGDCDLQMLEKRVETFGSVMIDSRVIRLDGMNAVRQFIDAEITPSLQQSPLPLEAGGGSIRLSGTPASTGRARGRARLVRCAADCSRVKPGDIMIAEMTWPEYIEAMQAASAIVTVDGGVLSHASIVARELRKPCLIDVTNAMLCVSDGQEINVDCYEGFLTVGEGEADLM